MLALAVYRDSLCPLCGWPRSVCQDPSSEFNVIVGSPNRCHVTTKRIQASEKVKRSQPGALLWPAELRG